MSALVALGVVLAMFVLHGSSRLHAQESEPLRFDHGGNLVVRVGQEFSTPLPTVSGGVAPYTFAVERFNLHQVPNWLAVDSEEGVFTNRVTVGSDGQTNIERPLGDHSALTFTLRVTDSSATPLTATQDFTITVQARNAAFGFTGSLFTNGRMNAGEYFALQLPEAVGTTEEVHYCFDVDPGCATWAPTEDYFEAHGLRFNHQTRFVYGYPTQRLPEIKLKASYGGDLSSNEISHRFQPNSSLNLDLPPEEYNYRNGQTVNIVFPEATGGRGALTYSLSSPSGTFPSWLTFNAETRTLSGSIPANEAPTVPVDHSLVYRAADGSTPEDSEVEPFVLRVLPSNYHKIEGPDHLTFNLPIGQEADITLPNVTGSPSPSSSQAQRRLASGHYPAAVQAECRTEGYQPALGVNSLSHNGVTLRFDSRNSSITGTPAELVDPAKFTLTVLLSEVNRRIRAYECVRVTVSYYDPDAPPPQTPQIEELPLNPLGSLQLREGEEFSHTFTPRWGTPPYRFTLTGEAAGLAIHPFTGEFTATAASSTGQTDLSFDLIVEDSSVPVQRMTQTIETTVAPADTFDFFGHYYDRLVLSVGEPISITLPPAGPGTTTEYCFNQAILGCEDFTVTSAEMMINGLTFNHDDRTITGVATHTLAPFTVDFLARTEPDTREKVLRFVLEIEDTPETLEFAGGPGNELVDSLTYRPQVTYAATPQTGEEAAIQLPYAAGEDPQTPRHELEYSLEAFPGGGPATLPGGLTLSMDAGNRAIVGTATRLADPTSYLWCATNHQGKNCHSFILEVAQYPLEFATPLENQTWNVGEAVNITLPEALNPIGTLTYTVSDNLPDGLIFDPMTRQLSGVPTTETPAGSPLAITYTATDTRTPPQPASDVFFVAVEAALPLSFPTGDHQVTVSFGQGDDQSTPTVRAQGGNAPLSYSISPSLPTALTLDTTTGNINGSPPLSATEGSYTLQVTDQPGTTEAVMFQLSYNYPPTVVDYLPEQVSQIGVDHQVDLSGLFQAEEMENLSYEMEASTGENLVTIAQALNAPHLWDLTGSAEGTATILVTARDQHGATSSSSFDFVIEPNQAPEYIGEYPTERISLHSGATYGRPPFVAQSFRDANTNDQLKITYEIEDITDPDWGRSVEPELVREGRLAGGLRFCGLGSCYYFGDEVNLSVTATDQAGLTESFDFEWTASFENECEFSPPCEKLDNDNPPYVTSNIENQELETGEEFSFVLRHIFWETDSIEHEFGSDPDRVTYTATVTPTDATQPADDLLTFSVREPSNYTVEDQGVLTAGDITGSATVTVTATDTRDKSASITFMVTVVEPIGWAEDELIGDQVWLLGQEVDLYIPPPRDEGHTFTYTLEGTLPAGVTFDPATRKITGTPTDLVNYSRELTVTATDQADPMLEYEQKIRVAVNQSDDPPFIEGFINDQITQVGSLVTVDTNGLFSVPDEDTLDSVYLTATTGHDLVQLSRGSGGRWEISGLGAGTATIAAVGRNQNFAEVRVLFRVEVEAATAPRLAGNLPTGSSASPIMLNQPAMLRIPTAIFVDDNTEDTLTYSIEAENTTTTTQTIDPAMVTEGGQQYFVLCQSMCWADGEAGEVTFTATDSTGEETSHTLFLQISATASDNDPVKIRDVTPLVLKPNQQIDLRAGDYLFELDQDEMSGDSLSFTLLSSSTSIATIKEITRSDYPETLWRINAGSQPGETTVTVQATDGDTNTLLLTIPVSVGRGFPAAWDIPSQVWYQEATVSQPLPTVLDTDRTFTYALEGDLPTGVTYTASTRTISGTPTTRTARTHTLTWVATDTTDSDNFYRAPFQYAVNPARPLEWGEVVLANDNTKLIQLSASDTNLHLLPARPAGGETPYTFAISPDLPTGTTLNAATGHLSGQIPAVPSGTSYTITVTDNTGAMLTGDVQIDIDYPPLVQQFPPNLNLRTGDTETVDLDGVFSVTSGESLVYLVEITTGDDKITLTRSDTNRTQWEVEATAAGSAQITAIVSDPSGQSSSVSWTVEVTEPVTIAATASFPTTSATSRLTLDAGADRQLPILHYFTTDPDETYTYSIATGATFSLAGVDISMGTGDQTGYIDWCQNTCLPEGGTGNFQITVEDSGGTTFTSPQIYIEHSSTSANDPLILNQIPDQELEYGERRELVLGDYFWELDTDVDGNLQEVAFTLTSNNQDVLIGLTPGSDWTQDRIWIQAGESPAEAQLTITATDVAADAANNRSTTPYSFGVQVPPPGFPADEVLGDQIWHANEPVDLSFPAATDGTNTFSYTWQYSDASGSFPRGLTYAASTRGLTGTPTSYDTESQSATLRATPASGSGNYDYRFRYVVNPPIALSWMPEYFTDGMAESVVIPSTQAAVSVLVPQARGGTRPYQYEVMPELPTSLTLDAATGEITGTIPGIDPTPFMLTVTDAGDNELSTSFELSVSEPPAITRFLPDLVLQVGQTNPLDLTGVFNHSQLASLTYRVEVLTGGFRLSVHPDSNNTLLYQLQAHLPGSALVQVIATDPHGTQNRLTFAVEIEPRHAPRFVGNHPGREIQGQVTDLVNLNQAATFPVRSAFVDDNTDSRLMITVTATDDDQTEKEIAASYDAETGLVDICQTVCIEGTGEVVVTATDEVGERTEVTFDVEITDSQDTNPFLVSPFATVELEPGETYEFRVADHLWDFDFIQNADMTGFEQEELEVTVVSSSTTVTTEEVEGEETDPWFEGVFRITAGDTPGTATITVTGTDTRDKTVTTTFTVTVVQPTGFGPDVSIEDQIWYAGYPVSLEDLPQPQDTGKTFAYTLTGNLPTGVTFSDTERSLSGVPQEVTTNEQQLTYTATDTTDPGLVYELSFKFVTNPISPISWSDGSTALTTPQEVVLQITDTTVSEPLPAPARGVAPFTFELSDALPPGLTLNQTTGYIEGSPPFFHPSTNYTLTITDAVEDTITAPVELIINQPPEINGSFATLIGQVGVAATVDLSEVFVVAMSDPLTYELEKVSGPGTLTFAADISNPESWTISSDTTGMYVVKAIAEDRHGLASSVQIELEVEANQPPRYIGTHPGRETAQRQSVDLANGEVPIKSAFTDPNTNDELNYRVTASDDENVTAMIDPVILSDTMGGRLKWCQNNCIANTGTVTVTATDQTKRQITVNLYVTNDASASTTPFVVTSIGNQELVYGQEAGFIAGDHFWDTDTVTSGANTVPQPLTITMTANPTGIVTLTTEDLGEWYQDRHKVTAGTTSGTTTVTVTVTDGTNPITETFTVTVSPPTGFPTSTDFGDQIWSLFETVDLELPTPADAGKTFSYTLEGTLPRGVNFQADPPALSGSPAELVYDERSLTLVATDTADANLSYRFPFKMVVNPPNNFRWTEGNFTTPGAQSVVLNLLDPNLEVQLPQTQGGQKPYNWALDPVLPDGLNLDPATGIISGTPDQYVLSFTSTLTVTDQAGNTLTGDLELEYNRHPKIDGFLPDLVGQVDVASTADLTGLFSADLGDTLSYTVELVTPMRSTALTIEEETTGVDTAWSFTSTEAGTFTLAAVATDQDEASSRILFDWVVEPNHAPRYVGQLEGTPENRPRFDNTLIRLPYPPLFEDDNTVDQLTYTVAVRDLANPTREVDPVLCDSADCRSYNPDLGPRILFCDRTCARPGGNAELDITATDQAGLSETTTFHFQNHEFLDTATTATTQPPVLLRPFSDLDLEYGESFEFLAGHRFMEFDYLSANQPVLNTGLLGTGLTERTENLIVSFSASPPGLLAFSTETGQRWFSHRHTLTAGSSAGTVTVTITAKDERGQRVSDTFVVRVVPPTGFAPELPDLNQIWVAGSTIEEVELPEVRDRNRTFAYTLQGDLPDGVSFDVEERTLSGTPTAIVNESKTLTLVATDTTTPTITYQTSFHYAVNPPTSMAWAPEVLASAGMLNEVVINLTETTFSVPTATVQGGQAPYRYTIDPDLPAGLTLDPDTGHLEGSLPVDLASLSFTLTVTDNRETALSASLPVSFNYPPYVKNILPDRFIQVGHLIPREEPEDPVYNTRVDWTEAFEDDSGDRPDLIAEAITGEDLLIVNPHSRDYGIWYLTGLVEGTALIRLTATDAHGAKAEQTFRVTIERPVPPRLIGELPIGTVSDPVFIMDRGTLPVIYSYVDDNTEDEIVRYEAGSGENLINAAIDPSYHETGDLAGRIRFCLNICIRHDRAGQLTIRVTDSTGLQTNHSMFVEGIAAGDNLPIILQRIPNLVLEPGQRHYVVPEQYFWDIDLTADGDPEPLTVTIQPRQAGVVSIGQDEEQFWIEAQARGTTLVNIRAVDTRDREVSYTFLVTVSQQGFSSTEEPIEDQLWLVGSQVSLTFPAVTDPGKVFDYRLQGTLPPGLSFDPPTRTLSGIPTQIVPRVRELTLEATDRSNTSLSYRQTFSYTVGPAGALEWQENYFARDVPFRVIYQVEEPGEPPETPKAQGGQAPYTYETDPALPAGLTLDSVTGQITGTAPFPATSSLHTLTVTDQNQTEVTGRVRLIYNHPPTLRTRQVDSTDNTTFQLTDQRYVSVDGKFSLERSDLLSYFTDTDYRDQITIDLEVIEGARLVDLSLNEEDDWEIEGVAEGTATFRVKATDTYGATSSATFPVLVEPNHSPVYSGLYFGRTFNSQIRVNVYEPHTPLLYAFSDRNTDEEFTYDVTVAICLQQPQPPCSQTMTRGVTNVEVAGPQKMMQFSCMGGGFNCIHTSDLLKITITATDQAGNTDDFDLYYTHQSVGPPGTFNTFNSPNPLQNLPDLVLFHGQSQQIDIEDYFVEHDIQLVSTTPTNTYARENIDLNFVVNPPGLLTILGDYSQTTGPLGGAGDESSYTIVALDRSGVADVTVHATDEGGRSGIYQFRVTIQPPQGLAPDYPGIYRPPGAAPELIQDQDWYVSEGVYFQFPEAVDAGKTFVYTLEGTLPAGLSFSTTDRTITGSPTAIVSDAQELTYIATDSSTVPPTVYQASFWYTVNRRQTFQQDRRTHTTHLSPTDLLILQSGIEASTPIYQTTGGVGPNSYTVSPKLLPPGLSLDATSGYLEGTPTRSQTLPLSYQLRPRDSAGSSPSGSDNLPFSLAINDQPTVETTEVSDSVLVGQSLDLDLTGDFTDQFSTEDRQSNVLSYTLRLVSGQEFVSLRQTQPGDFLSWTIEGRAAGTAVIQVLAMDQLLTTSSYNFTVTVTANRGPRPSSTPLPTTLTLDATATNGHRLDISGAFEDPDTELGDQLTYEVEASMATPTGTGTAYQPAPTLASDNSYIDICAGPCENDSSFTLTITVTDNAGLSHEYPITVNLAASNDQTPYVVQEAEDQSLRFEERVELEGEDIFADVETDADSATTLTYDMVADTPGIVTLEVVGTTLRITAGTTVGSVRVTITVTDAGTNSATDVVLVQVVDAPQFADTIPDLVWETATATDYQLPVATTSATGTITYELEPDLPDGLTLETRSAEDGATQHWITGTPTAVAARTEYTWSATSAQDHANSLTFNLEILDQTTAPRPSALDITSTSSTGTANQPPHLQICWSAPTTGGEGVTGYRVERQVASAWVLQAVIPAEQTGQTCTGASNTHSFFDYTATEGATSEWRIVTLISRVGQAPLEDITGPFMLAYPTAVDTVWNSDHSAWLNDHQDPGDESVTNTLWRVTTTGTQLTPGSLASFTVIKQETDTGATAGNLPSADLWFDLPDGTTAGYATEVSACTADVCLIQDTTRYSTDTEVNDGQPYYPAMTLQDGRTPPANNTVPHTTINFDLYLNPYHIFNPGPIQIGWAPTTDGSWGAQRRLELPLSQSTFVAPAPANFTPSLTEDKQNIQLSWDFPEGHPSYIFTGWEYRTRTTGNWTDWTEINEIDASATTYTLTGLEGGNDYDIELRGIEPDGTKGAAALDAQLANFVPGAPIGLNAMTSAGSVELSWASIPNNGTTLNSIQYRYRDTSTETWTEWTMVPALRRISLTDNTEYEIQVRGVNVHGEGPAASLTVTPPNGSVSRNQPPTVNIDIPIRVVVRQSGPLTAPDGIPTGSESFNPSTWFTEPDMETLTYSLEDLQPTIASVDMDSGTPPMALLVSAVGPGSYTARMVASDPDGLEASVPIAIKVLPANQAPVVEYQVPPLTLDEEATTTVDLAPLFSDPEHEELNYSVSGVDSNLLQATVSGTPPVLTITAEAIDCPNATCPIDFNRETTFTLTASEIRNPDIHESYPILNASQTVTVTISNLNQAPTTQSLPLNLTLAQETTQDIDLRAYFTDPDMNPLQFSLTGYDANVMAVAGLSLVESTPHILRVEATFPGEATVLIEATEGSSLPSASLTVVITVTEAANRGPRAAQDPITSTVEQNETVVVELNLLFTDTEEDDSLTFSYTGGNRNIATLAIDNQGQLANITGVGTGSTTFNLFVSDGVNPTISARLEVTVTEQTNEIPTATESTITRDVVTGESVTVDLDQLFDDDEEDDSLTFTQSGGSATVATLTLDQTAQTATITGVSVGTTIFTLEASDNIPGHPAASLFLRVNVTLPVNLAPTTTVTSPVTQGVVEGNQVSVDMGLWFDDVEDDDRLVFTQSGGNSQVARLVIDQTAQTATITGVSVGSTTFSLTASDGVATNPAASLDLRVNVVPNQPPQAVYDSVTESVEIGLSIRFSVGVLFTDREDDADLAFGAQGGDPTIATLEIDQTTQVATLTGVSTGTTTYSLTASDGVNPISIVSLEVTVTELVNDPPTVALSVVNTRVELERSVSVPLDGLFYDPEDDQQLVFSQSAGSASIASLLLNQSNQTATITGVAVGTTTYIISASDAVNDPVSISLVVTVGDTVDDPPRPISALIRRAVGIGGTETVDLDPLFIDEDDDSIMFSQTGGNPTIATLMISQATQMATITGVTSGTTTFTITATDAGGQTATMDLEVVVGDINDPPTATQTDIRRLLTVDDTEIVDLDPLFTDPEDDDSLIFSAASGDTTVASLTFDQAAQTLTITALSEGLTGFVISATDSINPPAMLSLDLTVVEEITNSPIVVTETTNVPVVVGASEVVDLDLLFHDTEDDDSLTFDHTGGDTTVATLVIDGPNQQATVTGVSAGSTTFTVTATDTDSQTASLGLAVTVSELPDLPPQANEATVGLSVEIEKSQLVYLDPLFTDTEDDDSLAFDQTGGDAAVATLVIDGPNQRATVTAVAVGTTTFTITATDSSSQTASSDIVVEVTPIPNNAPRAEQTTISRDTMPAGSFTVDLDPLFTDTEEDGSLVFSQSGGDNTVATLTFDQANQMATVTGVGEGTTTIVITASDGTDNPPASLSLVVNVALPPNEPTLAVQTSVDRSVAVGGTETIDLDPLFTDTEDDDSLTFAQSGGDTAVATLTLDQANQMATVTGVAVGGPISFTITASDGTNPPASLILMVSVVPPNEPTLAVQPSVDRSVAAGGTEMIDLDPLFTDTEDDDSLTFAQSGGDTAVATLTLDQAGQTATVTGVAVGGPISFTITASDGTNPPASLTLRITVTAVSVIPTPQQPTVPVIPTAPTPPTGGTDTGGTDTGAPEFTDTGGNTHEANISRLAAEGITRGCNPPTNSRFCPDRAVTRAEMATFLVRALGLSDAGQVAFSDITGNIHSQNILLLATEGITRGCNPPTNTRFCPDRAVTRAEMATFMVRGLSLVEAGAGFTDTVGNVHAENISRLATAGITRGCNPPTNSRFCPDRAVTRAEMATFMVRAFGY